jgi:hypothetical protein
MQLDFALGSWPDGWLTGQLVRPCHGFDGTGDVEIPKKDRG